MSGEVRKQNRVSFSYSQIRLQKHYHQDCVYSQKHLPEYSALQLYSSIVFFPNIFHRFYLCLKLYKMIKLCVCEKEHRIKT